MIFGRVRGTPSCFAPFLEYGQRRVSISGVKEALTSMVNIKEPLIKS